eukprot:ctg_1196.g386
MSALRCMVHRADSVDGGARVRDRSDGRCRQPSGAADARRGIGDRDGPFTAHRQAAAVPPVPRVPTRGQGRHGRGDARRAGGDPAGADRRAAAAATTTTTLGYSMRGRGERTQVHAKVSGEVKLVLL